MTDPTDCNTEFVPAGHLELAATEHGEYLMLRCPAINIDASGCGVIVFTPEQAREFAKMLIESADECELARLPRC